MNKSNERRTIRIQSIVFVGLMAALVFVSSMISITIPNIVGITRIHFGNIFCVLAGILLGKWRGGLAAGIGSALYDLTNPAFVSAAPITFLFKFILAFVVGWVVYSKGKNGKNTAVNFIGAALGSLTYLLLYLAQVFLGNIWFDRVEVQTALINVGQKAITSGFNGIVAVVVSVPLAMAVNAALKRSKITL